MLIRLAATLTMIALTLTAVAHGQMKKQLGTNPKDAFILQGDIIVPQIATGGDGTNGFYMTFQLVNITNQAATTTMQFFDSSGTPMSLQIGEGGEETTTSVFMIAVGAKGAAFARTFPIGNPAQIGYAQVTSAPARSVAVSATFNQVVPGRALFQSYIPLSTSVHDQFFVPILNAGSTTGSVAIVSLAEQEVSLTLRDRNGIILCSTTKMFTAGQHRAFIIKQDSNLNCAADRNTVLEVFGPSGGLAGVGVSAEDTGSFSTQPVYGPVPAPILAGQ